MYEFTPQQQKDLAYFRANVLGWLEDNTLRFKHVIIAEEEIIKAFDGLDTAVKYAVDNCKKGEYIIQQVVNEDDIVNFI
jgi:hypothetical protein